MLPRPPAPGRRRHLRLAATALLLLLAACGGGPTSSDTAGGPTGTGPAPATGAFDGLPSADHVVVLVLENTNAVDALADPTFQAVAARGLLLHTYYGVGHHSLPNYLAMTSGVRPSPATADDCPSFGCRVDVPSLATSLDAAHRDWAEYVGGTSTPCTTPVPGTHDDYVSGYVLHHNPFAYYPAVGAGPDGGTAACRRHLLPLGQAGTDAAAGRLPAFSLLIPDSCEDGHDQPCADGRPGGFAVSMPWLRRTVAAMTSSASWTPRSRLVVTFDEAEGDDTSGCCGGATGGRVATVVIGGGVTAGATTDHPYTHWSLLRSVEDWLRLPGHLGMAADPATTAISDRTG